MMAPLAAPPDHGRRAGLPCSPHQPLGPAPAFSCSRLRSLSPRSRRHPRPLGPPGGPIAGPTQGLAPCPLPRRAQPVPALRPVPLASPRAPQSCTARQGLGVRPCLGALALSPSSTDPRLPSRFWLLPRKQTQWVCRGRGRAAPLADSCPWQLAVRRGLAVSQVS